MALGCKVGFAKTHLCALALSIIDHWQHEHCHLRDRFPLLVGIRLNLMSFLGTLPAHRRAGDAANPAIRRPGAG